MAFEFLGDMQRADATKIETLWAPMERFTLAEKAEADSKAGGLPLEKRWTDIWQYPPAEVINLRTLRGRDLLFQRPGAPEPTPTPAPPVVPGEPTP